MINNTQFEIALKSAIDAGKAIMEIYLHDEFNVEYKADHSPLTKADKAAHHIISEALNKTGIPVLSEESEDIVYETRKNWNQFWLVDPLDGTKEFIKRNGEFTVNIALIDNNLPTAGIIYVPATKCLYFGIVKQSAWKINLHENDELGNLYERITAGIPIYVNTEIKNNIVIVGSRSHMSKETEDFISKYEKKYSTEILSRGSSLKICMIAEGKAHLYPRFAPTMEWDTAAGHAIAKAAGAEIINWETKTELQYNKQNLTNPWFLVKPNGKEF
jgi:3'(2'), 5'-bisphosphate nucleotidase